MSYPTTSSATLPKNPTTSYVPAGTSLGSYGVSSTTRVPKQQLGQEDFLKLLSVQFQQQDPMKPMEDTAFIAQMAQFSSLEQMSSLTSEMSRLRAQGSLQAAQSMLGREVVIDDGSQQGIAGRVDAIDTSTFPPAVVVGGKSYALDDVIRVEPWEPLPAA